MRIIFLYGSILLLILSACNPLRKLPQGKYFLEKNIVRSDSLKLSKEEITSSLKQKPNRKILGVMRLHLGLYNLGNAGDTTVEGHKFLNKFWKRTKRGMREIGEAPVLVDSALTEKSRRQLQIVLQRKGFFNAQVSDTIVPLKGSESLTQSTLKAPLEPFSRGRKAYVLYNISAGPGYKIRNVSYTSQDTGIASILNSIMSASLIKQEKNYDEDILDKERDRITAEIRDRGMYFFNRNYITYEIDSTLGTHHVDIYLYVNRQFENIDASAVNREPENHHRYRLNNIYIFTNYESGAIGDINYDTTFYKGYYFISPPGLPKTEEEGVKDYLKKDALLRAIFIKPGDQFNQADKDYTFSRLFDLNLFRFINFRFKEVPRDSLQPEYLLDVQIQLSPLAKLGYKIESELTQNGGNLGVAGSLSFQNKNIFRSAGSLEFKVSGSLEALRNFADSVETKRLLFFNTYSVGPEVSLGFKKFLLPAFIERRTSRYFNPKTILSMGFNYQDRPDYKRLITRFSVGYQWRTSDRQRFAFYPFEINAVRVDLDPQFYQKLLSTNDQNLIYSYNNHLITSIRLVWELTDQTPRKEKNFFYLRTNIETAGNILYLFGSKQNIDKETGRYSLFGIVYSQYFKPDIDFSYHQVINPTNTMVYRVAGGMGFTYGNSKDQLLPFDKAFFAGGSNDNRAWLARTLGPGSYIDSLNIENGGDIKLAANVEYRSALFKILEIAAFADAGNVWLRKDASGTLSEGVFTKNFVNDVAVGAGFGIRLNFTFFIIRTDFGVKLRDPALSNQWVYSTGKRFNVNDIVPNLAIGYPF